MGIIFSKVILLSDDFDSVEFLTSCIPKDINDFLKCPSYQRFIGDHLDSRDITVKVNSFLFGQGKTEDINIYEIISNKKQGDDFFDNSKVQKIGQFEFIIENYQSEETNLEME